MAKLTLYQFEECPYCAKVRAKLKEKGLDYGKINVPKDREDQLRKELFKKGGVPTVPVLKVEENDKKQYLGESDIIISYLEENY